MKKFEQDSSSSDDIPYPDVIKTPFEQNYKVMERKTYQYPNTALIQSGYKHDLI